MNNRPNYFSLYDFDRLTEDRIKSEKIKKILESSDSLIIPVCGLKNLISLNPKTKAVFFRYADIKKFIDSDLIFLGRDRENFYFTVDVYEENNFIKNDSYKFDDLRKVASVLDQKEAAVLAYAKSMIYWKGRVKFCGKCGSPTILEEGGHKAFCPECKSNFFPHIDPAIIVIVTNQEKCLLARQPIWPPKRYSVIAGFVEPGESLENAVSREVLEETGIKVENISYHSSQHWPFPGSIMIGFNAEARTTEIILRDKELEDAKWFTREEIQEKVKSKELKLSTEISISFRLIEDWFNSGSQTPLCELVHVSDKNF
jgi:NAD+ diphosphatase